MNTLMKSNGNDNTPATTFSGLVDKLFQNNLHRFFNYDFDEVRNLEQNMNVPVNIFQTDKGYELDVIAPGLKKEDFKINVSRETLTVSFDHKEETQSTQKEWVRNEYKMRSFSRSFTIDDTIDVAKIEAKYSDGILRLNLPKREGAQPMSRTIEIK